MNHGKFIQISTATTKDGTVLIIALDELGQIWKKFANSKRDWTLVSD